MTVGFSAFEISYANRAKADPIRRLISIEASDGPVHSLNANWHFEPRDENHTQVHFSVDYEFRNPVLAAIASHLFSAMFGEILNAFERRALQLFPDRNSAGAMHRRR
jgi:coenzyme Q-binding protein COQ10